MAKQAVTASAPVAPPPAIAPRQPTGERVQRVTGAATASEVPTGGQRHAPPMQPDPTVQATANATKVIQWDNGAPRGTKLDDETPPGAALGDQTTAGTEAAAGGKPAKVPKDRDEPLKLDDDETPPAAAAKTDDEPQKPAPAARRSAALANLEAERRARELETTVKDLQKKLEAVEPVAKSIREGTLAQKVKALGLSKTETAELLEKLLVKDPELEGGEDAPAAAPKKSAEVLALEKKLEELEAKVNGREGNEQAANIARAEANVAEDLKDADLPLTQSEVPVTITEDGKQRVVSPYHLVLLTSHQMWLDSGKNGHPRDFVKKAGNNVEAHLREKNPKLAARLAAQAARTETEDEPAPAPRGGSPSLGKRAGGGAPTNPPKLPKDRDARDIEIKRQFGW